MSNSESRVVLSFDRDMHANLKDVVETAVASSETPQQVADRLGVELRKLPGVLRRYNVKLPWTPRLLAAAEVLHSHGVPCGFHDGKLQLDCDAAERVAHMLRDLQKIEDRGCV